MTWALLRTVGLRWLLLAGLAAALLGYGWLRGAASVRDDWERADLRRDLQDAQALVTAHDKARRIERDAATREAAAERTYQESLTHEKARHDRLLADARRGAVRLSVPVRTVDACPVPAAAAGTGRGDGEARAELSDAAAGFLVGLAFDADTVVRQLTACQAIVDSDREASRAQAQ
ncbi:lysis system i-spanin subunit Rz [Chitinolyticbacter meiyuanensis]|uniref:lysis system i-spanin subunit Rz n=1 Tax=Chitinolyticbacter meiyuanensis TaxID=682798 RepID=UPI0011E5B143|nr:lysis system i-spanin subunit Rz [Chitinolyticbacter meiyuanensis]